MAAFSRHALAGLLIPASLDAQQALRLRRLGLAGLLPCFAVIGGEISALRRRLRDGEARNVCGPP